jgi:hypothetical protein
MRFVLIGLTFVGGFLALFLTAASWKLALPLWVVCFLLLYGHFRHGTVVWAMLALRRGEHQKAKETLLKIKRPEWLSARYKHYYHLLLGVSNLHEVQNGQYTEAAKRELFRESAGHFEQCAALNKGSANEMGSILLNLTQIEQSFGNIDKAKAWLQQLSALSLTDLQLKEQVEQMQKALGIKA